MMSYAHHTALRWTVVNATRVTGIEPELCHHIVKKEKKRKDKYFTHSALVALSFITLDVVKQFFGTFCIIL